MKVETFGDVVRFVRKQYSKRIKKESKIGLWKKILRIAYELYGSQLGYGDEPTFNSDLSKLAAKQRKEFSITDEEKEVLKHLNKRNKPSLEGKDCFSFTLYQIKNFDLNADSYT